MLLGGDLLHLPEIIGEGSVSFVIGAGGLMDFVFLSGVIALAMAWAGDHLLSAYRPLNSEGSPCGR